MPKISMLVALAMTAFVADRPGSQLTVGMQMVYSAGDAEGLPWTIVSARDTVLGGMVSCRAIGVTMGRRPLERRLWCNHGDTLFAWDSASNAHKALRPTGEGMRIAIPGSRGTVSQYETRSAQDQTVGGLTVSVIETIVVTTNSEHRPIQRLREFYAPGLTTATSGVFEVPDSTVAGGWRTQTSFKLVRISR